MTTYNVTPILGLSPKSERRKNEWKGCFDFSLSWNRVSFRRRVKRKAKEGNKQQLGKAKTNA